MRINELEEFINENRGDFDKVESFDTPLMWDQIVQKDITAGPPIKKIILWSLIISISILSAVILKSINSQNKSFETIAGLSEKQEMQRDEMIQYVSLKEQKLKEKNINISELSDFANELKGLDEIEQLIVGDFSESINKEKLVKSMLQYYESKARILELILLEIENKEKDEIFEKEIY